MLGWMCNSKKLITEATDERYAQAYRQRDIQALTSVAVSIFMWYIVVLFVAVSWVVQLLHDL